MNDRKIPIGADLLDLIVGMTKTKPADRYTIDDIKNHQFFNGETATPEEMKMHFYQVTGKAQEEAKASYESNQ